MRIQAFTNAEDLFKLIEEARTRGQQAHETLPPFVLAGLQPGSFYLWESEDAIFIFGEILEPTDEENKETLQEQPWLRFVWAASVACPEGEMGTVYTANMIPLTKEGYETAKANGWRMSLDEAKTAVTTRAAELLVRVVPTSAGTLN